MRGTWGDPRSAGLIRCVRTGRTRPGSADEKGERPYKKTVERSVSVSESEEVRREVLVRHFSSSGAVRDSVVGPVTDTLRMVLQEDLRNTFTSVRATDSDPSRSPQKGQENNVGIVRRVPTQVLVHIQHLFKGETGGERCVGTT